MSVEDILKACRADDGDGASASVPESTTSDSPAAEESSASSAPTPEPASDKPPGEMSVADMLAAARNADSGSSSESAAEPAAEAPAAKAAAPSKPPGEMSVADMLAAARASDSGASAEPAAAKAPAKAKPQAAPKDKASPKAKQPAEAQKPVKTGPMDTASILAAARKDVIPGPMSKQEAAAKSKPAAPTKPKIEAPPMPAKPVYAQPAAPGPEAEGASRRGFFTAFAAAFLGSSMAVGFTSLAVTNLLWLLGFARFMFPNILIEPPTQFKVGFPDEFGPGQVETKFKAQFGVWVVRFEYEGEAQIYALSTVCTHLGCTPNWLDGEQKFKCPCHGSGFYKSGINFEGPAPRPLERYAIQLADDGQLEVDKSRKFQEELGQWQDSASFVSV